MITDWVTYKNVTGDTFTAQATVEANLLRAQSRVEGRTGRLFDLAERTESLPVHDGKVWPSAYPVASVSLPATATVTDDKLSINVLTTSWQDDPALVAFSETADPPYNLITYVGGYAAGAAPVELVDIVCEIAQRYGQPANTAGLPAGASSVSAGGQSYAGATLGGASALPPHLKQAIRAFDHPNKRAAD